MVELIPVTRAHCIEVAKTARHPAIAEYEELLGAPLPELLQQSVSRSVRSWACLIDGDLIGIGGLKQASLTDAHVEIWYTTCDAVLKHKIAFIKAMRQWLAEMLDIYHEIHGFIDLRFEDSIKLDKWLGFDVAEQVNTAPFFDAKFYRVVKRK